MKSALTSLFILIALTCSCSQQKKGIDKSVTDPANKELYDAAFLYADAMSNYLIDSAEHFATKEARKTTFVMARNLMKQVSKEYIDSDTPAKIAITKIELTSDTSALVTYHKKTPIKNFYDTLPMRYRDGKWLVHKLPQLVERPPKQAEANNEHPDINVNNQQETREIKSFEPGSNLK
jgi:hypothetical protein